MTRISTSPLPLDDRGSDRAVARSPSGGTPFRAALRAANKDKSGPRLSYDGAIGQLAAPDPIVRRDDLGARGGGDAIASTGRDAALDRATSIDRTNAHDAREPRDERSVSGPRRELASPRHDRDRVARSERSPRSDARAAGDRAGGADDAAVEAAAGSAATANAPDGAAPSGGAEITDSPVAAWVAAAVSRAIGKLGDGAGASQATGDAGAAAATAPVAAITADAALSAMTPLEQAVHDLIGDLAEHDAADRPDIPPEDADGVSLALLAGPGAAPSPADEVRGVSEPARAAPVAELPDAPVNPSHVHLVLDDGPERTVVTVAVRGSEVRVALRASDETTAALARNAGSLDHAMRARGLALGELTTAREPHDQQRRRDREPHERRPSQAEPFKLEDKP